MPKRIFSALDIKREFQDLQGFIGDVRDWAPVVRCSTRELPAAVIAQTQFFDTGRALPDDNLERASEFPYRTVILGYSWQAVYDDTANTAPLIADVLVLFEEGEWEFQVDNLNYPTWPAHCLPGGGGVNAVSAPIAAGAATNNVSNGLNGNEWRMLFQPIAVDIDQNFRLTLRSLAATALGQITKIRFAFYGIEARRPV